MGCRRIAAIAMVAVALASAGCSSGSLVTASDLAALATPTASPVPTALPTPEPTPEPTPSPSPTPEPTPTPVIAQPAADVYASILDASVPEVSSATVVKQLRRIYKAHPELAAAGGPIGLSRALAESQATDCVRFTKSKARTCHLFLSVWLFGPYQVAAGGTPYRGSAYEASGWDPDVLQVGVELARGWVRAKTGGATDEIRGALGVGKP